MSCRWIIAFVCGSALFAQTPLPPMDGHERLRWLAQENVSPADLLEDAALGGIYTAANSPKEYGPHWDGFGKRTGMIAANYGVNSVLEASLGSTWGEDPRYVRTQGLTFGKRLGNVIKMTFCARNSSGETMPAYSRYLALTGGNFLQNAWRPDSQATLGNAAVRAGLSFLGRMSENAYKEFKPW